MPAITAATPRVQERRTSNRLQGQRISVDQGSFGRFEAEAKMDRARVYGELGDMLFKHAMRMKEEEDEADALSAYNKFSTELLDYTDNPQTGKLHLERKAARGITSQGQKDFQEMVLKHGEGLRGNASKKFKSLAQSDMRSTIKNLSHHEANEHRKFRDDQFAATIDNLQAQTISRPSMFGQNMQRAQQITIARFAGHGEEVVQANLNKVSNSMYLGIIQRQLTLNNFAGAKEFIETGKRTGELNGESLERAERAFDEQNSINEVDASVDSIQSSHKGIKAQIAAARKIDDPKQRRDVEARLLYEHRLNKSLTEAGKANGYKNALNVLEQTRDVKQLMQSPVWGTLSLSQRNGLRQYAADLISGRANQVPDDAWEAEVMDIVNEASLGNDPKAMQRLESIDLDEAVARGVDHVQVARVRSAVANAKVALVQLDRKAAAAAQSALNKGQTGLTGRINAAITANLGPKPTSKVNSTEAQAYQLKRNQIFNGAMQLYERTRQESGGKPLNESQIQEVLRDATTPILREKNTSFLGIPTGTKVVQDFGNLPLQNLRELDDPAVNEQIIARWKAVEFKESVAKSNNPRYRPPTYPEKIAVMQNMIREGLWK